MNGAMRDIGKPNNNTSNTINSREEKKITKKKIGIRIYAYHNEGALWYYYIYILRLYKIYTCCKVKDATKDGEKQETRKTWFGNFLTLSHTTYNPLTVRCDFKMLHGSMSYNDMYSKCEPFFRLFSSIHIIWLWSKKLTILNMNVCRVGQIKSSKKILKKGSHEWESTHSTEYGCTVKSHTHTRNMAKIFDTKRIKMLYIYSWRVIYNSHRYALHTHTQTMSQHQSQIYDCNNMWIHMHDFIHSLCVCCCFFFTLRKVTDMIMRIANRLAGWAVYVCVSEVVKTIRGDGRTEKITGNRIMQSVEIAMLKRDIIVRMFHMIHFSLNTHTFTCFLLFDCNTQYFWFVFNLSEAAVLESHVFNPFLSLHCGLYIRFLCARRPSIRFSDRQ